MERRIVVIGAGPGGYVAALRAARLGAEVTVVENDRVGGTCLNWGCIPSKVMKTTADLMVQISRSSEFGISISGDVRLVPELLAERRKRVIDAQAKGIHALFKQNGIRHLQGFASLAGANEISVHREGAPAVSVPWDRLIVSSGSRPMSIPSIPFDGKRIISSNEALFLDNIPGHIVIIGGGVIGCEFAFIFSAFGARVTIVEAMDRMLPLPSVDEECSRTLQREMKKRKISLYTGMTASRVELVDENIRLSLSPFQGGAASDDPPACLEADLVLACIGRRPNTGGMGLAEAGVCLDEKGWIRANRQMETDAPGIYAVGDVLGPDRIMLAHVASMEGIVAAENAMGQVRELNYDAVPFATFTMPEVAHVGLTETQARQRFENIRSDSVLFRSIGKAQVIGELGGMAKLVSDAQTGRILGVHLVGPHATDLIAEGVLAVRNRITVRDLAETIHAHPTLAEVMYEAALKAMDRTLHG